MTTRTKATFAPTIAELAPSFRRSLEAQNRSGKTLIAYSEAVRLLDGFLAAQGMPREVGHVRREHIESFIKDQLTRLKPVLAASRYQQFWRWAVEDGEVKASPMANMRPPTVPDDPPPVMSEDDLRALLKACEGQEFVDRRDMAIVRLWQLGACSDKGVGVLGTVDPRSQGVPKGNRFGAPRIELHA